MARGVEENVILASHITPVIRSDPFQSTKAGVRYIDDLFFRVSDGENGSCDVFGHSHSTVSFELCGDTVAIFLKIMFLVKLEQTRVQLIMTSQQTTATCAT